MTTAGSRLPKLVLALAIVGLLAGDAVVVVARRDDPKPAAGTSTDRPTETVPSAERRALEAALPELIAFVEQTRGLRFKQKPEVKLLSSADFDAELRGDFEAEEEEGTFDGEAAIGVLRALGLIDGDVDLETVFEDQLPHILGFYDTETKILYARGISPTPFLKQVLVHELTHALDDQHFDLFRPDLDDEASPAFDALTEGSATWVEGQWYDSRPAAEQEQIDAEEGGLFDDVPENVEDQPDLSVFEEFAAFPYAVGPFFVMALVEAGGTARLDEAFRSSPTNTEHILHPDRFLAGEGEPAVARARADGPVVQEGRLGELGLIQILDTAMTRGFALQAANGWGNDSYVAWTSGAQTCVRANIVMDSTRDTTELVNALRTWARTVGGATVTGTRPVSVTRCA